MGVLVIEPVDCDDYGDTTWKYYAYYKTDGIEVWGDYFKGKPSEEECVRLIKEYKKEIDIDKDLARIEIKRLWKKS